MKKSIFITFLLVLGCLLGFENLHAQSPSKTQSDSTKISLVPKMTFDKPTHDFGLVKKGEVKYTEFTFTNTGDVPIEIDLVARCECTDVDYPILPVKPGEKGTLKVTFNSAKKDVVEVIYLDIICTNIDPRTDGPFVASVNYTYQF